MQQHLISVFEYKILQLFKGKNKGHKIRYLNSRKLKNDTGWVISRIASKAFKKLNSNQQIDTHLMTWQGFSGSLSVLRALGVSGRSSVNLHRRQLLSAGIKLVYCHKTNSRDLSEENKWKCVTKGLFCTRGWSFGVTNTLLAKKTRNRKPPGGGGGEGGHH